MESVVFDWKNVRREGKKESMKKKSKKAIMGKVAVHAGIGSGSTTAKQVDIEDWWSMSRDQDEKGLNIDYYLHLWRQNGKFYSGNGSVSNKQIVFVRSLELFSVQNHTDGRMQHKQRLSHNWDRSKQTAALKAASKPNQIQVLKKEQLLND